jgi:hypothetical protein
MNEPIVVTTQARGRVTLGALATASQYIVHSEADGVLVLEPATVLSVTEKKLLENSALMAAIQDSREHPEKMVKRDRTGSPRA